MEPKCLVPWAQGQLHPAGPGGRAAEAAACSPIALGTFRRPAETAGWAALPRPRGRLWVPELCDAEGRRPTPGRPHRALLAPGPTSGLLSPASPSACCRSSRHLTRCWHMWAVAARVLRSCRVSSASERHRMALAARARSSSATRPRSSATSCSGSRPGWPRSRSVSLSFSSSCSDSLSIS